MKKVLLLFGLVLLIGLGVGTWLWIARQEAATGDDLVLYGNVDIRQVNLAFNGSERIARMLVREGEWVKKGQLLAELETEGLEHSVAHDEAEVAAQRQIVARLEAGTRHEDKRKARAEMEAAAVEAENAERNARRLHGLALKDMATQEDADNARAAADAARARLQAAQEANRLAIAGPRKEDIAEARATLQALEARLALTRHQLNDSFLYAPADGVIQDRILEPGDMVTPQSPVYTVALADPLWVRAYVAEPDLGKLHQGLRAMVSTDSFPGKRYPGWVGYISPTAEFTPKSVETTELRPDLVYQVRVFVCNPQRELRLGMPATVTIPLHQAPPEVGETPAPCETP